MKVRVQIYEDNVDLRDALSLMIRLHDDFEEAGVFENASNVTGNYKQYQPDVILMDIDMPEVNGLKGLALLKSQFPKAVVIMLTVFEDNKHLFDALCAGASGYILKQISPEKLPAAIMEAYHGGSPMSPTIARKVVMHFASQKSGNDYALSPREKEILTLLTNGNSYKMIAADLDISIETVKTHIKKIYEKLQVRSQSEAVSKALKDNIV